MVKAQVLAGGRGKGRFDSGLQGGVHMAFTPEDVHEKSKLMIGAHLITKQTDSKGKLCEEVGLFWKLKKLQNDLILKYEIVSNKLWKMSTFPSKVRYIMRTVFFL